MKGKIAHVSADKKAILINLETLCKHKVDTSVMVNVKRPKRSTKQNSLYWVKLEWVIDQLCEASDIMRPSPEAVHENLKQWYRLKYNLPADFSTAELDSYEYTLYCNRVDCDVFTIQLGVDIRPFWSLYDAFCDWLQYNPDGSFREFREVL